MSARCGQFFVVVVLGDFKIVCRPFFGGFHGQNCFARLFFSEELKGSPMVLCTLTSRHTAALPVYKLCVNLPKFRGGSVQAG